MNDEALTKIAALTAENYVLHNEIQILRNEIQELREKLNTNSRNSKH